MSAFAALTHVSNAVAHWVACVWNVASLDSAAESAWDVVPVSDDPVDWVAPLHAAVRVLNESANAS